MIPIHRLIWKSFWIALVVWGCEEKVSPPMENPWVDWRTDTAQQKLAARRVQQIRDIAIDTKCPNRARIPLYAEALAIAEMALPDSGVLVSKLYKNMALAQTGAGNHRTSAAYARKGLEWMLGWQHHSRADSARMADFGRTMGNQYSRQLRLDEAERWMQYALITNPDSTGKYAKEYVGALNSFGVVYQVHHELDRSIEFLNRARGLDSALLGGAYSNIIDFNIAEYYRLKGELEQAYSLYAKVLESYSQQSVHTPKEAENGMGFYRGRYVCALALKKPVAGLREKAIEQAEIAHGKFIHREKGLLYLEMADAELAYGDPKLALEDYQNALPQFGISYRTSFNRMKGNTDASSNEPGAFLALVGSAKAMIALGYTGTDVWGQYQAAMNFWDMFCKEFQQLGDSDGSILNLYPAFEDALDWLNSAEDTVVKAQQVEWAFELMERARQNDLVRALVQVPPQLKDSFPAELVDAYRKVSGEADAAWDQLHLGNLDAAKMWVACQSKLDSLKKRAQIANPHSFFPKYDWKPWDSLRQKAGADTLLLGTFLGKKHLYILAGNRLKDTLWRVEWTPTFADMVNRLPKALNQLPDNEEDLAVYVELKAAYPIYEKMLLPAKRLLGNQPLRRLYVSPDGRLAMIPFATLPTQPDWPYKPLRDWPLLIKETTVSYVQSFLQLMQRKEKVLVKKGDALSVGINQGFAKEDMQPLSFAEAEAKRVNASTAGQTWLSVQAVEERFKQQAGKYSLLHLATHGELDPTAPLLSSIIFHADSESEEDGILRVAEIPDMKLGAKLAFLSACQTGNGEAIPGIGVISVGWGFRQAGCDQVVMSLWDAFDGVSPQIADDFYQNLNEGLPVAEALRKAQLAQMALGFQPQQWSGIIVSGTGDLQLEFETNRWNWILWAILGGLLLLVIGIWGVRLRRGSFKG